MGLKKKLSEKKTKESPVSASAKPRELQGKSSADEIDAIFGKKRRKAAPEMDESLAEESAGSRSPSQSKKKKKKKSMNSTLPAEGEKGKTGKASVEHTVKGRKKTEDGLAVYGEDELKWNSKNAGGTRLCPFDCDCCF